MREPRPWKQDEHGTTLFRTSTTTDNRKGHMCSSTAQGTGAGWCFQGVGRSTKITSRSTPKDVPGLGEMAPRGSRNESMTGTGPGLR